MKRLFQHPIAQAALAKTSGLYLAFALRTTRPPLTPLQARQAQAASRVTMTRTPAAGITPPPAAPGAASY